jgi:drug/metabolite transporter (DMT)-like permease
LLGAVFVVLTSLQFGSVVILGKIASRRGLPVTSLLAVRFGIAAALLALALAGLRMPMAAAKEEGWRLVVLGMAGYALEAALFFAGLRHGTAAAVTLLFFTYPVLVALIAFLTGKGLPGWLLGGALAFALAGSALVVLASGGVDVKAVGVAFALGSSFTYALYLVGAEAVLKVTNSLAGALWVSASAALALAAAALASGSGRWPHGIKEWVPVVGMGVFTAGAFATLFAGLRRLGAVRTAILSATEPLTAAILAAIFLGEKIRPGTVTGGALILAGAVTASLARRPRPFPSRVEPPGP